jgi:hypothetical protein
MCGGKAYRLFPSIGRRLDYARRPAKSSDASNSADHRKHSLTWQVPLSRLFGAGLPVQYKQFTISAYQRQTGKWRARVWRSNGRPLIAGNGKPLEFVTAMDSSSEADAMSMALAAIDAGAFSRTTQRNSEKFWRRTTGRKSRRE